MPYNELFDKKLSVSEAKTIAEYFIVFGVNDESTAPDPKIQKKNKKKSDDVFKKIYNECMPTIHLARQLNADYVEFITDEDKHHDALFYFEVDGHVETIEVECVTAMNQADGALRIEYLNQFGTVSKYGEVKSTGTKNKRTFEKMESYSTTYVVEKKKSIDIFTERIPKSVKDKIETQKKNNVYNKTILIVYFDDKCSDIHPNDFLPTLNDIVHAIRSLVHSFKGIYLVGTSRTVIPVKTVEIRTNQDLCKES